MFFRRCLLIPVALCCAAGFLSAEPLYQTDFEDFTAGAGQWAGTDGWIGSDVGAGAHGIDQDILTGLGKTAFIGFAQPSATLTFVAQPILHSAGAGAFPLVRVETLLGIEDSNVKTARDSFFVSVYNASGSYLAGIRFDNRTNTFGIWREDGANSPTDTGMVFFRGELHLLSFEVDLIGNSWSAELDGIPLFSNAPFTASGNAVDFGYLAYEWQLNATNATGYGDNWMLVADTVVRAAPLANDPFVANSINVSGGTATVTWDGQNGFDYQVQYSDDLSVWKNDLPGSSYPGVDSDGELSFSDHAAVGGRCYRVARTETE